MPYRQNPQLIAAIEAAAVPQQGLELLVLFGSRARGDARPESDWDFAYQGSRDIDRLALMASLSAVVQSDRVDVLNLGRASGLARFRVARDGVLIREAAPGIFDRFRLAAARFWFDAEPVLLRGYDSILENLG